MGRLRNISGTQYATCDKRDRLARMDNLEALMKEVPIWEKSNLALEDAVKKPNPNVSTIIYWQHS